VNTSLNGTIPAFVKNKVGSLLGTRELLETGSCPSEAKKSMKRARISDDFTGVSSAVRAP
jgi:hypothetical protein